MRQAAEAVGVSRQTIYRDAASGKVSTSRNAAGQQVVDTSELVRVYGELRQPGQSPDSTTDTARNRPRQSQAGLGQHGETAAVQVELATLQARLKAAEAAIDDMRMQLGKAEERERQARDQTAQLLGVLERQTLLLTHQPAAATSPPPRKAKPKARKAIARKGPTLKKAKVAKKRRR